MKIKLDSSDVLVDNVSAKLFVESNIDLLKNPGVYAIHNKVTNKYYIGSTTVSLIDRLFYNGASHRKLFLNGHHWIINNENKNEFEFIILFIGDSKLVRSIEKKYIMFLKSYLPEFGYNKTKSGGFGGIVNNQYGLGNKSNLGRIWFTNGTEDYKVNNFEDIRKGFYPGRWGKSYCKLFNDKYGLLEDRNHNSEYLVLRFKRSEISKLIGNTRSQKIQRLLDKLYTYYNIDLILE